MGSPCQLYSRGLPTSIEMRSHKSNRPGAIQSLSALRGKSVFSIENSGIRSAVGREEDSSLSPYLSRAFE